MIQARWWNVGSRSRNAKGNAESDEQGRNVPKSASVADCPVVALSVCNGHGAKGVTHSSNWNYTTLKQRGGYDARSKTICDRFCLCTKS